MLAIEETFKHRVTNVVFMGMGEPMMNLKSVLEAHRCFNKVCWQVTRLCSSHAFNLMWKITTNYSPYTFNKCMSFLLSGTKNWAKDDDNIYSWCSQYNKNASVSQASINTGSQVCHYEFEYGLTCDTSHTFGTGGQSPCYIAGLLFFACKNPPSHKTWALF